MAAFVRWLFEGWCSLYGDLCMRLLSIASRSLYDTRHNGFLPAAFPTGRDALYGWCIGGGL
jgi:hypothetical protein